MNVRFAFVGHQRRAECGESRATAFQRVENFDDEQIGSSVGRMLRAQNVFEIPAVTRRNRTRSQKSNQPAHSIARREIFLVLFVLEEIDGEEPLKSDLAAARSQPALAETRRFAHEFFIYFDHFRNAYAGSARLVYTRSRFLRAIASRSPCGQI